MVTWFWIITLQWETPAGDVGMRTLDGTVPFRPDITASERYREVSGYAASIVGKPVVVTFYQREKEN